ncbi:MAG: tRNA epoxyqueuosine(34) reductase QueG [Methylobacteriaceae bacterium]|nr:tRNA epoxyqueuosine(34) reductase QueG [Methylobacteriaceae bacterium]
MKEQLAAKARELGFAVCRVAAPDAIIEAPKQLAKWLSEGAHGNMDWMAANAPRRANPRELWPDVRSIIMLGMNYGPEVDPLAAPPDRGEGNISVYARHRDYHDLIKGKLKQLASWLIAEAKRGGVMDADVKVFVDTAPVMEKPLSAAAGIGWQGKHTNLVSREFGSWLFLGSIFTTLDLAPDTAEADHCGTCRACLDICPTQAFPAPYRLDARRCISYLTIEHRGQIAREFRAAIGNRIYGCDDCLAVCPWNKFAAMGQETKLQARDDLIAPRLAMLASLDDTAFRAFFAGSPIKRTGYTRFLRNVLIAIGNSGDPALVPVAKAKLTHDSPLVRGMAVWSLARLLSAEEFRSLAQSHAINESDETVHAEWDEELGALANSQELQGEIAA